MYAAGEDLESTKPRLGGQRIAIRYMKGTMFAVQTSRRAKQRVGQKVLVHLFYNLRKIEEGKFSTHFVAVNIIVGNQYEGTKQPFLVLLSIYPFSLQLFFFNFSFLS